MEFTSVQLEVTYETGFSVGRDLEGAEQLVFINGENAMMGLELMETVTLERGVLFTVHFDSVEDCKSTLKELTALKKIYAEVDFELVPLELVKIECLEVTEYFHDDVIEHSIIELVNTI